MVPPLSNSPTKTLLTALLSVITPRRCLSAAIIFFVLMVILGAIPGEAHALSEVVYDKLLHFLAYSVLSGLIYASIIASPVSRALLTVLAVGSLGALDEAIQTLMPYRDANWMDWKADMMASLSCVTLLIFLHVLYSRLGAQARKAPEKRASAIARDLSE
ncbi:MAG TPA: VanZ family protein [Noviherbaspirillum sp.]|nr:VanZ family protein [Noviherbaspirillum sp.]